MRLAVAVLLVVVSGAIAAVILGEYEFTGTTPWLAAAVFGVLAAEIGLSVARRRHNVVTAATALTTVGAILWAAYISTGRGVAQFPAVAWPAAAVGAAVATWWARPRRGRGGRGNGPASPSGSERVVDEGDAVTG